MNKKQIIDRRYGSVITESYKPSNNYEGPVIGTFSTKGMAAENTVSQNETFYSTQLWASSNALGKGGKFVDENGKLRPSTLYGSADHPVDEDINKMLPLIKESAIVWKDITRNPDGTYDGTADILNTPNGKVIKVLLDYVKENGGGDVLGVSSRGLGESKRVNEAYSEIIPESYELLAFDFVFNPSFSNSASLVESRRFNQQPITEAIRQLADKDKDNAEFYKEYAEILEEEVDLVKTKEIKQESLEPKEILGELVKSLKTEIHKLSNALYELDMLSDEDFKEKYPNKSKSNVTSKLTSSKQELEKLLALNLKLLERGIEESVNESVDFSKHIWEGWTVRDFIEELNPQFERIMRGQATQAPFKNRAEIKKWCMDNQPYYKKYIPEVVDYFCSQLENFNESTSGKEQEDMKTETKDPKVGIKEASDLEDAIDGIEDDFGLDEEVIEDKEAPEEEPKDDEDDIEEEAPEEIKDPELKLVYDKLDEVLAELANIKALVEPVENFESEEEILDEVEDDLEDIEDLDLDIEEDLEEVEDEVDLAELSDEELESLIDEEEEYLKANK